MACIAGKLAEKYSIDMPSTFIDGSSLDAEIDRSHPMLLLSYLPATFKKF